jgi:hypothetical protein
MSSGVHPEVPPLPLPGDGAPAPPEPSRPVLRNLLRYLRRPRVEEPQGGGSRWWVAAKLLGIDVVVLIPLLFLVAAATALIHGEEFTADEGLDPVELAVLAVVFAPLVEETAFRLYLTHFRPLFAVLGGTLMAVAFSDDRITFVDLLLLPALALVLAGVAGLMSIRAREWIAVRWEHRFAFIFYGSALVFGLAHLFNYSFASNGAAEIAAGPLLIAPQLAGGLILAYGRVRLGFWYAVAMHAVFNAAVTVPVIFA